MSQFRFTASQLEMDVYKNEINKSELDTSNWVTVSLQHALGLKMHGSHLSCKTIKKMSKCLWAGRSGREE